jgi:hypothetical protein
MALIERLMHDPAETEAGFISVHEFFASITELLYGKLTAAQIQNYYSMTAADLVDWNALAAQIPAANQTAARAMWAEHIHAAFILAEHRVTTYSTPAEVRTRLGI